MRSRSVALALIGALAVVPATCAANDGGGPEPTSDATGGADADAEGPAHVEVVRRDGAWTLLRDGAPYVIHGAGGDGPLDRLKAAGANSLRTWGVNADTGALLDRAHALGLTVTVGLWLGHPRHGMDYGDAAQVAEQLARVRAEVERLKDHPALLMWGVGNEVEGFEEGDDARIWEAIEEVAAMIHRVDPHHPTMAVTAEIGGARVAMLNARCPSIDVHGVNSYGGLPSLNQRYLAAGGTKPWVATEYGPPGTWEVAKTSYGAPLELTSGAKADHYRAAHEAVAAASAQSLGSYAFVWSAKDDVTATWYGMLLPGGDKLAAVDAMTARWGGAAPANRCPTLTPVTLGEGQGDVLQPEAELTARVAVDDPDGDEVSVTWVLRSEAPEVLGGDPQAPTRRWPESIVEAEGSRVTVRMPAGGGVYRLYAIARDGRGGAAVANVPLKVDGPALPPPPARATLPLVVYGEDVAQPPPYTASGWMGETAAIAMDQGATDTVAIGEASLRVDYQSSGGWGGVVWQSPANDWGDLAGGWDLTGANVLSLWARGARGGEKIKLLVGIIGDDKPFPDSARRELEVTLGVRWQRYFIDLRGLDLSRIKTGFGWVVLGQGQPVTFYLDEIRYEE